MPNLHIEDDARLPEVVEKKIDAMELLDNLLAVLEEIDQNQSVYFVRLKEEGEPDEIQFVLGPEVVCGKVIGLHDDDYGWPAIVDADYVKDITILAPGYRRHPYITHHGACLAVGIHVSEYEEIKRQFGPNESPRQPR